MVGLVDLVIRIGAGAIVLAHRMNARGIAERREIVRKRARIDGVERLRFGLARHLFLEEKLAMAGDQRLRQRIWLRQKRPMVDLQRGEPVQLLPVIIGRRDIEHREF